MKVLVILCCMLSFACTQATQKVDAKVKNKDYVAIQTALTEQDSVPKINKTEAEWKKELSDKEFYILREKGTERAFTGDLLKNKEEGTYVCAACSLPLFESSTKFKSGTGWPSFWEPTKSGHVLEEEDTSYGMRRVEVVCGACDGHLGHVFDDGPKPTGLRYCINSVSLDFVKKEN